MLGAIASLVATRTALLGPLYLQPPYEGLRAALGAFAALGPALGGRAESGSAAWHLANVGAHFDALLELMEKQVRRARARVRSLLPLPLSLSLSLFLSRSLSLSL